MFLEFAEPPRVLCGLVGGTAAAHAAVVDGEAVLETLDVQTLEAQPLGLATAVA